MFSRPSARILKGPCNRSRSRRPRAPDRKRSPSSQTPPTQRWPPAECQGPKAPRAGEWGSFNSNGSIPTMAHELVVISPEKTVLTYRLAGLGSRVLAHLFDFMVVLFFLLVILIGVSLFTGFSLMT